MQKGEKHELVIDQRLTTTNTPRIMQADEDFNIRFVNMVKKHRCLYDKKVPEYRNRDYQEKAWSVISQETRESGEEKLFAFNYFAIASICSVRHP